MDRQYKQLSLKERKEIEDNLNVGTSFREIGRLIERPASTISREVRENRHIRAFKARKAACRERNWCKRINVCSTCVREKAYCSGCDARDCREECSVYATQAKCDILTKAPWVCNACSKNRYGCNRANRYVYSADVAHKTSAERRSDTRKGIDMPKEKAEVALSYIKNGVARGLSPYEISVLYEDVVGVHRSTIYRWVDAGYGGLTNLELERKVGFKARTKKAKRTSTKHSKKRSYEEFLKLSSELRDSRSELDCVIGKNTDCQAVLTLYNLPCHVQLGLLLDAHDCASVEKELTVLKSVMPPNMYAKWTRVALTDNGEEFSDESTLGRLFCEQEESEELEVHLYYCDPRQSQQKGGCEKNHSEIRQLLEKGMFSFDELTRADMRVIMSHVNSNPRESLGGKTPIQMLRFIYGEEDANDLLDAFGIEQIYRDELMLKPEILDIERAKRGEAPLTRLK